MREWARGPGLRSRGSPSNRQGTNVHPSPEPEELMRSSGPVGTAVHALTRDTAIALMPVALALAACSSGEKASTDSVAAKTADTATGANAAPAMFASAGATD